MDAKISDLFDLNNTIAKDMFEKFTYPWEVLPHIKDYILETGPKLDKNIYKQIGEDIWIAKSATIAVSAMLNGPLIICEDAEIRHCAFLRGSAIVGAGATIGNSCELKNCVIFDAAQAPHFNYVGDSVLGYKSHFGAGVIASNLRCDKCNVVVKSREGEAVETGLHKFGAILGDNVEVGCNTVLNPGSVIGQNTMIYPSSCVHGFIPCNSVYVSQDEIVTK